MKLSVVISTYNRRDLLARTLPTVLEQDFPAEDWEVVVVVDGSTDGTAEFLRGYSPRPEMRVLEQPNRGPASARNSGLAVAHGELLFFLDDDMRCERTLLHSHFAAHRVSGACVVFPTILIAPESPPGLATDFARVQFERRAERLRRNGWLRRDGRAIREQDVWVSNCSMPRSLLLEHGGYDESFRRNEDTELAIRLWKAGVAFRFQPDATLYQIYTKSSQQLIISDAPAIGATRYRLSRMHPSYRVRSGVAIMIGGSWMKLAIARLLCSTWLSPDPVLRLLLWIAERFRGIELVRRAGISLLDRSMRIMDLRAAMRQVGSWAELQSAFGVKMPALVYYNVGPFRSGTDPEWTVPPEQFEKQIRWLSEHNYTGVRPSDWVKWRRDGIELPKKPILITFDDGYADVAEHALPVLRRYGFAAGIYVVTAQIGGSNAWNRAKGSAALALMSADQIRHWAAEGFEFGAHSRTHADLTMLSSDRLREEIEGSGDDLARILKDRPTSFAYPYGAYNDAVHEQVGAAFDLGLSCDEGLNGLRTDPYLACRTAIRPNCGVLDFVCRIKLGYALLRQPRRRSRTRIASSHGTKA